MPKTAINTYRELSAEEVAKINESKELESHVARFVAGLETAAALPGGIEPLKPELQQAKARFTEAFMWVVRSIAKPTA